MSGTHFYLTPPSNASMDVFPDNKTTGYRVQLPQSIDLEGEWEVGLYSITYPHVWYTLENIPGSNYAYYGMPSGGFYSFVFEYGHYTAVEDLIKAINTGLVATGDVGDNIKLTYSALMKKVTVQIKNMYQFAVFKPLSVMLGFGDEELLSKRLPQLLTWPI